MRKYVKVIILFCLITTCFYIIYPPKVSAITLLDSIADWLKKDRIYKEPGSSSTGSTDSLEDLINDAEEFEEQPGAAIGGGTAFQINQDELQSVSSNIYTAFLIVATAITVIVGIYLGAKFMYGTIEAQSETKKLLKPYVIGCIVIFGSFAVWSLVVKILAGI